MRYRKALAILGVVGAVAAMLVVGTAFAQTPTPTPGQSGTNYQQFFLDRLAAALGTTTDKLQSALTQARNETVDQAVQDGKLTQQQADAIKSRQNVAPFGFGFHGFGRGPKAGVPFMGGQQVLNAVAGALGMTPQDLTTQLRSGKTLGALAQGKEQAVKDAITNTVKPQLDQQVANGRITQDRENQILSQIQNMDLNNFTLHAKGWNRGNGATNRTPGSRPSRGPAASGTGTL